MLVSSAYSCVLLLQVVSDSNPGSSSERSVPQLLRPLQPQCSLGIVPWGFLLGLSRLQAEAEKQSRSWLLRQWCPASNARCWWLHRIHSRLRPPGLLCNRLWVPGSPACQLEPVPQDRMRVGVLGIACTVPVPLCSATTRQCSRLKGRGCGADNSVQGHAAVSGAWRVLQGPHRPRL